MAKQSQVVEVFEYWKTSHGCPKAILTKERARKIAERIDEGYTLDQIKCAIEGIKLSPFHAGENDRGTTYMDIFNVCKEGRLLERFAYLHERRQARERHAQVEKEKRLQDHRAHMPEKARKELAALRQRITQSMVKH